MTLTVRESRIFLRDYEAFFIVGRQSPSISAAELIRGGFSALSSFVPSFLRPFSLSFVLRFSIGKFEGMINGRLIERGMSRRFNRETISSFVRERLAGSSRLIILPLVNASIVSSLEPLADSAIIYFARRFRCENKRERNVMRRDLCDLYDLYD